jgi:hypothetical protein
VASINEHYYKAPENFSCCEALDRASVSSDPSARIGEGSQNTSHCFGCEGPPTDGDIIIIIIIVTAPSKARVCSCSLNRIASSNPAWSTVVFHLWVLLVVRFRSLQRLSHSFRGVRPSVVCLSVIVKPRQWGGPGPLGAVAPWKMKNNDNDNRAVIS